MKKIYLLILVLFVSCSVLSAQGNVYLVLGSDTGMWEGLNSDNYNNFIKGDLYTVPERNGYMVMEASFREKLRDSYGGIMKLTWWMMGGNQFYRSINANTPVPNSMTMYLMKKHHGEKIAQWGDELSLHYHTFFWSDYDGDAKFYWNQAKTFAESRSDFDFTVAQFLIDEDIYPVSFRAGWHFRDNEFQSRLNELLPFSMDNAYPSKKLVDTEEPLDNVIDWSKAPATWVPYHPSPDNYQIPGDSKGWNLRSQHIGSMPQKEMDSIFARASRGIDQVACIWGHLPETDFMDNLKRVDSLAHVSAKKYPNAKFRYCTAIEAMQRWLKTNDTTAPILQVTPVEQNGTVVFNITVDEEIFQNQPFVAVKDLYERYTILKCEKTGTNSWRSEPTDRKIIAKAGVAVTDPVGNMSKKLINFLADDIFVDNEAVASIKLNSGSWIKTTDHASFDVSNLSSVVTETGSSITVNPAVSQNGKYNLFVQFAKVDKPVDSIRVIISKAGQAVDTTYFSGVITPRSWLYLATIDSDPSTPLQVSISTGGTAQAGKTVAFDALKVSPLVRDKEILIKSNFMDMGDIIIDKERNHYISVDNKGVDPLQVNAISITGGNASYKQSLPLIINGMSVTQIPVTYLPKTLGEYIDTVTITSNDPVNPVLKCVIKYKVVNYYTAVDNEDIGFYKESGTWSTSVARGYMNTSRFAYLGQKPGARAEFSKVLEKSGTYDVLLIVPETVNASNHALYVITEGSTVRDSVFVDQNAGSSEWKKFATMQFNAGSKVTVTVIDAGGNTNPNAVLRSDAIRFNLLQEGTNVADKKDSNIPSEYVLRQNYPNPFNPSTTISYSLPQMSEVTVKVFDIIGKEVATLVNGMQDAGSYAISFDTHSVKGSLSSGVYFYSIKASSAGNTFLRTMKMLYLK